jgi:hypothetical protein
LIARNVLLPTQQVGSKVNGMSVAYAGPKKPDLAALIQTIFAYLGFFARIVSMRRVATVIAGESVANVVREEVGCGGANTSEVRLQSTYRWRVTETETMLRRFGLSTS